MAKKVNQNILFSDYLISTPDFFIRRYKGTGKYTYQSKTSRHLPVLLIILKNGETLDVTLNDLKEVKIMSNTCRLFFEGGRKKQYSYNGSKAWEFLEIKIAKVFFDEIPNWLAPNFEKFCRDIQLKKFTELVGCHPYVNGKIRELVYQLFINPFKESTFQYFQCSLKLKELLFNFICESQKPFTQNQTVPLKHYNFVLKAKELLEQYQRGTEFTTISLAERIGTNETTLKYAFKKVTGTTIYRYFIEKKMESARKLLSQGLSVKKVSEISGYENVGAFSYQFKERFSISPEKFKSKLITKNDDVILSS